MIYLCTNQISLFENLFLHISPEKALKMMWEWNRIQVDSETNGKDCHINNFLCIQFGNKKADTQIVVDTSTVDIRIFKDLLETKLLILQNAKFDLQFFYNYGIIPRKIYDTMIVEQLLYLGYPAGTIRYTLKDITLRRCNIDIDKTVRGEIIWRGLDSDVIKYSAGDVMYLEDILESQVIDLNKKNLIKAALLENSAIPAVSYMEWCGIHLDTEAWKNKMLKDSEEKERALKELNSYVVSKGDEKFYYIERQGSLFDGYDLTPKCNINWDSPIKVVQYAKHLGFNTITIDKKTGKDKDTVLEKTLKVQKGIDDRFLKLYFDYKEKQKLCSTYGQGHLNAVNPNTGNIHTVFWQLGAASGRFSCGSNNNNRDLEILKHLPKGSCSYPNLQQLPANEETRSCFTASDGNLFISADFSAEEARLAGDIYQDEAVLNMFRHNIDSHSMYAKIFFKEELEGIDVNDIKKLRPDLRQLAKGPEFALNFGGGYPAIMSSIGCSKETAEQIIKNYEEGFKGTSEFAKKGSKFVRNNGYVLMCKETGHKMFWHDWKEWYDRQKSFNSEFWEEYKKHKGTGDIIEQTVKTHFKVASKWDRMARNAPTQGTGSCIMKTCLTSLFNWIIDNDLFSKVRIVCSVHDEICCEFPETMTEFPNILIDIMEKSASIFCKSLPIPAEASVGKYWIH